MTKRHYENAFHLLRQTSFWTPQVKTISSLENTHVDSVWGMMLDYELRSKKQDRFAIKRAHQNRNWLETLVQQSLSRLLMSNTEAQQLWPELEREVMAGRMTPFNAANKIIDLL